MKNFLAIFFLLSFNLTFAQPGKTNLDSVLQVTFPAKPTFTSKSGQSVYFLKVNSSYYFAIIQNLKNFSLSKDSLDSFYNGIVEGTIKKPSGDSVKKKIITIDELKAIEFQFNVRGTYLPDKRFQRTVYLNKKVFNFVFWTFADSLKTGIPKKDQFFSTIKVIGDKSNLKQYTIGSAAEIIGGFVGKFAAQAVLLGILALFVWGVVYLVKKSRKKKV